jgi:hypothetical protein
MVGFNADLASQMKRLTDILQQNEALYEVIKKVGGSGLKNHYVAAGCIAQTVWNYQVGNELMHGISDIDIVYFDASDLSYAAEDAAIQRVREAIGPCEIEFDIKNQARVHLWYQERFGYGIKPYGSVESGINAWPAMASSIGVRLENDQWKVYAPFGLNDLFGMVVRANKGQVTEEIYLQKSRKWSSKWPLLTVMPW